MELLNSTSAENVEYDFSAMDNVEFDDVPHEYFLNGQELPSVTTIMEPINHDKYEGIPKGVLNNAASKGTAVHNSIENYLKFGIDDIEPEYRGYFDAFLAFEEKYKPEVIRSEIRMYHKLFKYAGTGDLLCKIDGKLILIDYKSTAEIYEMPCRVQLEAYWQALASHGIKPDDKWILHLKKDGTYSIAKFPLKDARAWKIFGDLMDLRDYLTSYKITPIQWMSVVKSA